MITYGEKGKIEQWAGLGTTIIAALLIGFAGEAPQIGIPEYGSLALGGVTTLLGLTLIYTGGQYIELSKKYGGI